MLCQDLDTLNNSLLNFQSVTLDPTHSQQVIAVTDATKTIIETAAGATYTVEGGFLDIGILDTMKDLLVNLIGAVVFCTFGYVYLRFGEKDKVSNAVVKGLTVQPDSVVKEKEKQVKPVFLLVYLLL